MLLVLLIATAFAAAVYMGLRNPYVPTPQGDAQPLGSVVSRSRRPSPCPADAPPTCTRTAPRRSTPVGAAGISLPAVRRTPHFSESQIVAALSIAKDYLVQSSLDPDVLAGTASPAVRVLLDPGQQSQFDQSMTSPSGDGRHAATGWLVRFAPDTAAIVDAHVRVNGTLGFEEVTPDALEVTTDHTFVYAVRPATGSPAAADGASLFTVRRELRLRFDRADLVARRTELLSAYVMAGPEDCATDPAAVSARCWPGRHPPPSGRRPATRTPAASRGATAGLCGVLAAPTPPDASGATPPDRQNPPDGAATAP
ncbi:hypothetical protein ACFSNO_28205 [Streptomyces cirratus]